MYALKWPGDSPLRPSYERVRGDENWHIHRIDLDDHDDLEVIEVEIDQFVRCGGGVHCGCD